ncbi:hypothetical protein HK44_021310 [Pseudomonas fluorescens HK44]|uniref:Uncharacterized protein n=1 Tax=Pseudomonas fluorescens HK44 TaxID=1042209 RepID=A0A010T069_PSEFL|nr:hypothetical protein HK44_021310 [Pseudomonas fluorescens HK44]
MFVSWAVKRIEEGSYTKIVVQLPSKISALLVTLWCAENVQSCSDTQRCKFALESGHLRTADTAAITSDKYARDIELAPTVFEWAEAKLHFVPCMSGPQGLAELDIRHNPLMKKYTTRFDSLVLTAYLKSKSLSGISSFYGQRFCPGVVRNTRFLQAAHQLQAFS